MLRRYKPKVIEKVVADSGTPEFLANNDLRLYGATFYAEKAVGVENSGNIWIQVEGADAILLEPGRQLTWPQPPYEAGYFQPQDFKIRVATNGDGVRCITNQLV